MKKISQQQRDLIVAAANEGMTSITSAALEKDILLTEVLIVVEKTLKNYKEVVEVALGGGTSLIKTFPIIHRMSEDLDFKIILKDKSRAIPNRAYFGEIKKSLLSALEQDGFEITAPIARNENRYIAFELSYESQFDSDTALRPYIKIELTLSRASLPLVSRKVGTLLYVTIQQDDPYGLIFPSVNPTQTAAEKLIGLLRRVTEIVDGSDERLIRHIYDLCELRNFGLNIEDLRLALSEAINEDTTRYGDRYPLELVENPKLFLDNAFEQLKKFPEINKVYSNFVTTLTVDVSYSLEESLNSVKDLLTQI
jgi:predicted nucleotidyltransferase component of viral defense system